MYTHGITSNVFRPTHVRVGRALAAAGYGVVAGNNRGSGLATVFPRRDGSRRLIGTWYERLGDAVLDLAAWIDVAAASGARRVVLLGHSLGAAKVVLYASERRDGRIAGVVLASPAFHLVSRREDAALVARAQEALAKDGPEALIDLPHELTFRRMSAATFLDYAGGRANPWSEAAPRLGDIACPVLAFYGTEEPDIGGKPELERIARLVTRPFTANLITGANHMYVGHEDEAVAIVAGWLRAAVASPLERAPASAE